jgi:ABC-type uncharacterized transport system substrate-binding protein
MTEFGDVTAEMVVEVLNGANPGDMSVRVLSDGVLMVNKESAQLFELDLEALKAKGARFIGGESE